MDSQSYSRLLNFVVCELTMPVKKHVYSQISNYHSSIHHHLLTAAAKIVRNDKRKKIKYKQTRHYLNRKYPVNKHHNGSILLSNKMEETLAQTNVNHEQLLMENQLLTETKEDEKSIKVFPHSSPNVIKNGSVSKETYNENNGSVIELPEKSLELTSNINEFNDITSTSQSKSKQVAFEDPEEIQVISVYDATKEDNNYDSSTDPDIFHGSESSDEACGFYSDPLLLCSERDFMTMFRMTRTSFQNVLAFVSKEEMEPIENIPLYKKVLVVLWLMGTSASYSDAAQVFAITEEAAANCFFDVCATLYNRSDSVITWPDSGDSNNIALRIEKRYGFPGVVGVLGCHYFSISIPKEAVARREHFNATFRMYCISLQIVCDDRLVIRDIFPGMPGGKPEANVLRDSPLCEGLTSKTHPHQLVEPQKHILARKEYPQLTSMLTPYTKNAAELSSDEVEFNNLHESVCQLIDQTFQMLEDRFPTLKLLDPEVATMVLVAACVIHNICLEDGDIFEAQE